MTIGLGEGGLALAVSLLATLLWVSFKIGDILHTDTLGYFIFLCSGMLGFLMFWTFLFVKVFLPKENFPAASADHLDMEMVMVTVGKMNTQNITLLANS